MDERPCKRPQQGPQDGDPERSKALVPHRLGHDQCLFIDIAHGVVDEQKGHGHGIDDVAHQQPAEAVDVKELVSEEPGDEPLLPEGVDDGEAVGNGRQEHV